MPRTTTTKARKNTSRKTASNRKIASKGDVMARIGDAALHAKTGKTWAQWCKLLDKDGAKGMVHKDIAILVSEKHGVGPWWSQMVTVGYEQSRGLRKKHQTSRGWEGSVSRTINVPVAVLYGAWDNAKTRRAWLGPHALTIRKKTANKAMRITWSDGTDVDANFYPKGASKSQVAVQHAKLAKESDVARIKRLWSGALSELKQMLES